MLMAVAISGLAIIYNKTPQDEIVRINVGETYDTSRIFMDSSNKNDVSILFNMSGDVDLKTIGTYQVIFTPKMLFTKKYTRTFIVEDNEKPLITLEATSSDVLRSIEDFEETGYHAVDNYDGDITENVEVSIERIGPKCYEVTYKVSDSSGNEEIARRQLSVNAGTVCLTFDDGPSALTPQFLDVLKEYNVRATFFVVGFESESATATVKRAYDEGHTIGYHGYSHDYAKIYTSIDTLMENFYKVEEKVQNATGRDSSNIVRFPGGSSNTISRSVCKGIMTQAVSRIEKDGYIYFDWNVDSQDAGGAFTAEEIYNNVIFGIRKGKTNVVLMHDAYGKDKTLEALPRIIQYCLDNDYTLEAITEKTTPVHHNVAN